MKVYLDNIIFYIQNAGGISTYWHELISKLIKSDIDLTFINQLSESTNIYKDSLDLDKRNIIKQRNIPVQISRYFNIYNKNITDGIFHSSYYRICNNRNVKNIVTVHDFTYEFFRKGIAKKIHKYQKEKAIKQADGIICVSENTRNDLLTLFPEIDRKITRVIYHGTSRNFFVLEKAGFHEKYKHLIDKKYIIFIGDRIGYKNFDLSIDILSDLHDFHFLIIGGGLLNNTEKMHLREKLNKRFEHLDNISVEDLNLLYNNAFCLLYPSSYEGFGIPILEAMNAGCPVVTSNKSSIPEVCGNSALMVKEIKKDSFLKKIDELKRYKFRKELIEKGFKQANKFSWNKCFLETIDFYKQIK